MYVPGKSPFESPAPLRAYLEREFAAISRAFTSSVEGVPLLDAREFGVLGDGTTDNAVALEEFRDALLANPGVLGVLPGGVILCSSLTALDFSDSVGVWIRGGSALNGTQLVYTGAGADSFVTCKSSFGFSLSYVSLYHSSVSFTGDLISFSHAASGFDAQHGHLFRCAFGSLGDHYTANGVQLDQATLTTVENCSFGSLLRPVAGQSSAGGSYSVGNRVRDCQFANYGGYALHFGGQGWKITGNNFQPNKDGHCKVFVANVNTPNDGFTFDDNTVLDATGAAVVIDMFTGAAVNINGNVVGCGGSGAVFLRCNAAINGLKLGGNHISQATTGIEVANVSNNGWAINGNWFDTVTDPIDHPEFVTEISLDGNFPAL